MALISISLAGIVTLLEICNMIATSPGMQSSDPMPAAEVSLVARGQMLDLVLGLGCGRSVGIFYSREQAPRRVRAGIARALAADVRGIARIDVDGDPGVDASVPALDKVDKPGHTRLLNQGAQFGSLKLPSSSLACAAARRAIGTRGPEQDT